MLRLATNVAVSCSAPAVPIALTRFLHTSFGNHSSNSVNNHSSDSENVGSPGSKGAAPGRAAGTDDDVKFGDPKGCE